MRAYKKTKSIISINDTQLLKLTLRFLKKFFLGTEQSQTKL